MKWHRNILPTLTLAGSFSTLICCALPALLVSIGAGAALAGLVSAVPQLIWLSEHKVPLFMLAGFLLAVSGISRYLTRNAPCPIDSEQTKACMRLRRFSAYIFYFSLAIYAVGFFFAFIAVYLFA